MKRRSKAGGEPTKRRRPKSPEVTRRNAPEGRKYVPNRHPLQKRMLECRAARSRTGRGAGTTNGSIRSVGCHQHVAWRTGNSFSSLCWKGSVQVPCGAKFGNIYRWDGEALHILASHNTPPAFADAVRRSPYRPYPHSPIGRMVADRTVAHIPDVTTEEVYLAQRDPMAVSAVALGGAFGHSSAFPCSTRAK